MAIRVKEAGNILGVGTTTIRRWVEDGKLPDVRNAAGQRIFEMKDLEPLLPQDMNAEEIISRRAFYVRSSSDQDTSLESQISSLKASYGEPEHLYQDKCSGLRESRSGLDRMLRDAKERKFTEVCVTYPDRLARFGVGFIEQLLLSYGVTVTYQNPGKGGSPEEELMSDFMALIASFSGKFYRLRGWEQQRKLIERVKSDLDNK